MYINTCMCSTRPDTNQPVQLQERARSLKCWIKIEEELYCPCSENKGANQLICAFVFFRFAHDVVHLLCALYRCSLYYRIHNDRAEFQVSQNHLVDLHLAHNECLSYP